jgi:hypothetical protein
MALFFLSWRMTLAPILPAPNTSIFTLFSSISCY